MTNLKSWVVFGAVLAVFSARADRAVTQNFTLGADADWRDAGVVTVAKGVVVDLGGHTLKLSALAGEGAFANGALVVDVPAGQTVVGTAALAGNLRFEKAGAGVYLAARSGQTYTGGTEIRGGTFRCGSHGDKFPYGKGAVTVREGAVFDCDGWANHTFERFILDGGTIRNTNDSRNTAGFAWFDDVVLTRDAVMAGGQFGFVGLGWAPGTLDLQGHTLALDVAPKRAFYLGNLTVKGGGRLIARAGGRLLVGGNDYHRGKYVKAPETVLEMKGGELEERAAWGDELVFKDIALATPEATARFQVARALGMRVLPPEKRLSSSEAVFAAVDALDTACDRRWQALKTKEEFFAYGRALREAMTAAVGGFPRAEEKCPLKPVVVDVVPRDGYRIEKLYFESWPGVHVPANLFVPNGLQPGERRAGVLVVCGHTANGKGADMYQRASVVAVKAGFVVLIFDPFSQGERIVGGLCERHNAVGALAALLGGSMARYRLWDAMRALDYLESRPEVDKTRLGCMGQSGGGTMTSLMMSVEPRLKAACPCCFISRYYDTVRAIAPGDAEQNFFGMLPLGVNYTSMILMQSPLAVRLLTAHGDFFPFAGSVKTMREVKAVSTKFGLAGRYDMVDVDGKHDWPESQRVAAAEWMRRWLVEDPAALRHDLAGYRALDKGFSYAKVDIGLSPGNMNRVGNEAVCPGKHVRNLPGNRTPFDVLKDELHAAQRARAGKPVTPEAVRCAARLGALAPGGYARREVNRTTVGDMTVVREVFVKPDGFELPAVTFRPKAANGTLAVVVGSEGREARVDAVREELAKGRTVMALDLFATGEIGGFRHRFYGSPVAEEEVAVLLYALGKSVIGVEAEELAHVVATLKAAGERPVVVAQDRTCIAAAHAHGAYPEVVDRVDLRRAPLSWTASIEKSAKIPFAVVVNGALKRYDWTELVK